MLGSKRRSIGPRVPGGASGAKVQVVATQQKCFTLTRVYVHVVSHAGGRGRVCGQGFIQVSDEYNLASVVSV